MKHDFRLAEFIWRTGLVIFLGGLAFTFLIVGILNKNGQAMLVGLILGLPASAFFLVWLDRYYDYFFGKHRFK